MKLALVRQAYTPFGGAERFVERALAALRARGTDVSVIARRWQGGGGADFLRCDPFYLGRTWRDAGFSRAVQKIVRSGRFDLVQSHERIPGCHIYRAGDGVHATWLALRGRARGGMAAFAGAVTPWHRYTLRAEAAMFRDTRLKAVICNSKMVREDIARRFPEAAGKLHVIYNGVDLVHFQPEAGAGATLRRELGIAPQAPVLLFVGSGFERKGVTTLLDAMGKMRRLEARLIVVGRDRDIGRYEARSTRLGLGKRVFFLGGREDVRPCYAAANVFVLPTLYDPFPNAALEALACGLPVVTSTTCGAAELVEPGVNGALCAALDSDALADALDTMLDRPADPADIRHRVSDLGLDAMAGQLDSLYRQLARV